MRFSSAWENSGRSWRKLPKWNFSTWDVPVPIERCDPVFVFGDIWKEKKRVEIVW